jgi:hypothetical protein
MLFMEMSVYSEYPTKSINTLCKHNLLLFNSKTDGIHGYPCTLRINAKPLYKQEIVLRSYALCKQFGPLNCHFAATDICSHTSLT